MDFFQTMTQPDSAPTVRAVTESLRATLEAAPGAAFVIEPRAAHLLAVNDRGRVHYPMLGTEHGLALDGAMPAVRRLRDILRAGGPTAEPLPLLFWTAQGARSLRCHVEAVSGRGGVALLLLKEVPATSGGELQDSEHAAGPALVAGSQRSDSETLQEIARRIREGQKRHGLSAPLKEAADENPSVVMTESAALSPQLSEVQAEAQQTQTEPVADVPPETETQSELQFSDNAPSESAPPAAGYPPIDIGKLAHELKTPLSAIAAAAEIMKDARFGPVGNERYAGYVGDIYASAQHALTLIERMLHPQVDGSEASAAALQFERLDLDAIVKECISSVRPLAEAKGVDLVSHATRTPLHVTADATSLRQILLNLLTNAIKFTPARGTIRVTARGQPGGSKMLTVVDNGPGMSPVAIADAMRPVSPSERSVRAGGGLGIGLPLSRALAEANGAGFDIASAPGAGTRITLTFAGGPIIPI